MFRNVFSLEDDSQMRPDKDKTNYACVTITTM